MLTILGEVIQAAMGRTDDHLHHFMIRGQRYSEAREGALQFSTAATALTLSAFALREHEAFFYVYDFNAWWRHMVADCGGGGDDSADTPPESSFARSPASMGDEQAGYRAFPRNAIPVVVPLGLEPFADARLRPTLLHYYPAIFFVLPAIHASIYAITAAAPASLSRSCSGTAPRK